MQPEEGACLPGRRASVTLMVAEEDTAERLGSGDVPVLATPRVLALAEEACVKALEGTLPDGRTSVGTWVELEHRAPSFVGEAVTAQAVLLGVHGRRLEFTISVTDSSAEEVAHIRHHRVIVHRVHFTPSGSAAAGSE